jgi:shikimate dehydrogenase
MTDRVVLLGHHIGYSASPALHNAAFAALGLDARYELADVAPDGLADAVAALRAPDHLGANVTQPHKLAVCDLVDEMAPEARRLGAANTIVRDGDALVAHNTDLPALAAELGELGLPRGRAVVLGNGGASRAVQAALADIGAEFVVVNRSRWTEIPSLLADADLLVNATPIGTGTDDTPFDTDLLRPDLAVLDLVYRPSPTRLVRDALERGAQARGGAGMLLAQAILSFELWTGHPAPVAAMAEALRLELGVQARA